MTWKVFAAVVLAYLLGYASAPRSVDAQSPHVLFVASSAGAVPVQGSPTGVLTVNVQ